MLPVFVVIATAAIAAETTQTEQTYAKARDSQPLIQVKFRPKDPTTMQMPTKIGATVQANICSALKVRKKQLRVTKSARGTLTRLAASKPAPAAYGPKHQMETKEKQPSSPNTQAKYMQPVRFCPFPWRNTGIHSNRTRRCRRE